MDVTYKEGTDVETQQLDDLWAAIGWKPRGWEKWNEVLSKSSFFYTGWDGTRLIGTGRIVEDGIMCMFYDIGVHPDYQRQGVGAKILEELINRVKDKGYASIALFAWEENPANIPFYEKFGFVRTSGMELTKYMRPE
ncbi:MAG: GNAT family N-acetyltransferase [Candidatus Aenigmarchaeota archaeon]|nr:GNAT family N-acetyltransferase [Candidatus Aenigmarchaeota archaeon]